MRLAQIAATRKLRRLSRRKPSRAVRLANSARPPRAEALALTKFHFSKLELFEKAIEERLFPLLDEIRPPEERATLVVSRDDALLPTFFSLVLNLLRIDLVRIFEEGELDPVLETIGDRVAKKNARELRRLIGISAEDLGLSAYLDGFRAINVSRIRSIAGNELVAITQLLEAAFADGARVETIRDAIQDRFKVTKSKAALLARDQTLKLNGQITRQRQQADGITQYIWTTSGDSRVRPSHKALDGSIQSWDVPPPPGHPGEDYQCRCTAFPVLPELA